MTAYNPFGNACRHGVVYGVKNQQTYKVDGRCELCCSDANRKENEDEYERWNPIFSTDLSKGPDQAIEKIRSMLSEARGQCSDMGDSYSGWNDCLRDIEGLLTCGLVNLYRVAEEMRELKKKNEQLQQASEVSRVIVK